MTRIERTAWSAASVGVGVLIVAIWQFVAWKQFVSPIFLPGPDKAWAALIEGFKSGSLTQQTFATVQRMSLGWILASLIGVSLGARIALSELLKTDGSIIVTLSNSSFYPDGGGVMYIASKHAALGVVRQLAHEFAPHIRVNGVSPGATKTDIRMPVSFGLDERGQRIRTHTHPSNADAEVERVVAACNGWQP